ncbi:MAG: hypothetical protein JNK40_03050 [Chromatiales bacterium]|nr:hypothetical protein [Chromatiales bacterium]
MKNKAILATAVATAVGGVTTADVADAAVYNAVLTQVLTYSNNGTAGSAGNITSSTATFTYDDTTNLLTQTGGLYNARFTTAPTTTLYRTSVTGLVMGNGGAASAATYVCTEGNFGAGVGASICGNYSLGANFISESTTTWGPGTAASRTIGGDDNAAGPQQTLSFSFDGMNTVSFNGTTLVLANKTCTGPCATLPAGAFNNGLQWTLTTTVVPIPATAWLLGTGLLGVAGRKFLRKKA